MPFNMRRENRFYHYPDTWEEYLRIKNMFQSGKIFFRPIDKYYSSSKYKDYFSDNMNNHIKNLNNSIQKIDGMIERIRDIKEMLRKWGEENGLINQE